MSKQEMLVLSTKDRDRLKVLYEVKRKHLTQRAAAQQLGVSDRWVRKLLVRVKKEGDRGVVHRLRGRVSNRRLPEKVRRQALKLVEAQYRDFGPTRVSRGTTARKRTCACCGATWSAGVGRWSFTPTRAVCLR